MTWWLWMILGLALAIAEAQIPTNFFLLAFGVGGFAVGVLTGLGWIATPWIEWVAFTLVSVATLLVFQRTLNRGGGGAGHAVDDLRRESATVIDDVPANGIGRAELRGTPWNARGVDGAALARGTRCRVQRIDGLTLWLEPE
ncbi:MAG: NfeD family protein [Deltaproteobacteria bacterium]|nr:NfeD family protein [Deltaproteobacteria bacterium]